MKLPKPNAAQLRQMRRESRTYPQRLVPVPVELWPKLPFTPKATMVQLFRNRQFVVQVYDDKGFIRLSVMRTEWDERKGSWREGISWDDLQSLKEQAGYGDQCAVELFPPDDEVVNVANMRHLFIVPCPIFMWRK